MKKKKITISDYLIYRISQEKVKHVFILPGGGNMYLMDAVIKCKDLEAVPLHHEHAASIAAESYSRISNNLGVAIVTTGPGATNAITGILGAWIESVPLLIISGQVKTSDVKKHLRLRQQGVQGANILDMIKNITKYSVSLKKNFDIESVLNKCIAIAKENRGGPVWLEVPLDVQAALFKKNLSRQKNFKIRKINKIKNKSLSKVNKLLNNATRPVFLIGHGVRLSGGINSFRSILKKIKIPCLFTWNAMDLLSYDHYLNFGKPGVVAQRYPNFVLQNSDLLISVGCRIDNIITAFNEKNFAPRAKKVIVDIDQSELDKFNFKKCLKLNYDAKIFFKNLKRLKHLKNNYNSWIDQCSWWKKNYNISNEKKIKLSNKLSHYTAIEILSKNLPKNKIICTGSSGLLIEVFYSIFKNKPNQRIFLTSGLGSMGYGLPSAIGASFANNKKPLFLVEGDGSFQQNIQELAVIKQFKLPITIFLFNNNGYCSIKNTQKNYFNKRYIGTGPYSNLLFPDLKKISEAYKIKYLRIKKEEDLKNKIKKIIKNISKPQIIEINVDENEILAPKVSAIPQKNGNIISMPLEDMSPLLPIKLLEEEMLFTLSKASYLAKR